MNTPRHVANAGVHVEGQNECVMLANADSHVESGINRSRRGTSASMANVKTSASCWRKPASMVNVKMDPDFHQDDGNTKE
jgi:hypothetical protein